jgi:YVTN family beta-propeller protein
VVDYGFVWVSVPARGEVYRIDPKTDAIAATIGLLHRFTRAIASAEGSIWVLNEGDGTVQRIDAATDNVIATVAIGSAGAYAHLSAGGGYVWADTPFTVAVQIDPGTNRVLRRFTSPARTFSAQYGAGSLWIGREGSLLRIAVPAD